MRALYLMLTCCAMACSGGKQGKERPVDEAGLSVSKVSLTTRPPGLPEPEHLPPTVRRMLRVQMQRHADHAAALQDAVLRLDFGAAGAAGTALTEEPTLAHPDSDDATMLNAQLPEPFLSLQAAMMEQAERVVAVSREHNAERLAEEYGKLTSACVQCHAVYLLPQAYDAWR